MTNHSPTPWRVPHYFNYDVVDANDEQVLLALLMDSNVTPEANAAHIVHCVNSHDALVEALTECVVDLRDEIEERYGAQPIHPALMNKYKRDLWPVKRAEKLLAQEAQS